MKHLGLFEGIGGFSLAARWAGWHTVAWCEINPFCQTVLKYHFPNAKQHDDIKQTDFTVYRGRIDIVTGGFPCQPYSMAGKRLGKEDERHLWPEMLRAIREVQPRWVVGENVSGLINWSGGLVFDEVQADLEAEGYEVRAFVLPAAGVNAPHRRDRIWFIAYADNKGGSAGLRQVRSANGEIPERNDDAEFSDTGKPTMADANKCTARTSGTGFEPKVSRSGNDDEQESGEQPTEQHFGYGDVCGVVADADGDGYKSRRFTQSGCKESSCKTKEQKWQRIWAYNRRVSESGNAPYTAGESGERMRFEQRSTGNKEQGQFGGSCGGVGDKQQRPPKWRNFPTQSPICSRNDGFSDRLDGITFPKWRTESIKAYGNAIVPQVALQIFESINEYENLSHESNQ